MRICVYGASSKAIDKAYIKAGEELGREIAERGHSLVFGGGANGLMGAAARGAKSGGAKILGVAPRFFDADGHIYAECDELVRTDTMRQRKQILDDSSDGFIVTPGGIGTFEEFFEMFTLRQLGQSAKPIAVLNTMGYYDSMQQMIENAVSQKFMNEKSLEFYKMCDTPSAALDYVENYTAEFTRLGDYKEI